MIHQIDDKLWLSLDAVMRISWPTRTVLHGRRSKTKTAQKYQQGINENSRPDDDDTAFAFAAEDLTFPDVALLWLQPIFIN